MKLNLCVSKLSETKYVGGNICSVIFQGQENIMDDEFATAWDENFVFIAETCINFLPRPSPAKAFFCQF
jgi:hypothetical protein